MISNAMLQAYTCLYVVMERLVFDAVALLCSGRCMHTLVHVPDAFFGASLSQACSLLTTILPCRAKA